MPAECVRRAAGAAGARRRGVCARQNFTLRVTGVTAFSLEAFIAQAKHADFLRLVATVEGLHNEVQLIKGYLALAALRLKKGH